MSTSSESILTELESFHGDYNSNSNATSSDGGAGYDAILAYLKEMSESLDRISKNVNSTSQSNARNSIPRKDEFKRRAEEARNSRTFGGDKKRPKYRTSGDILDDFLDSFEDSLIEGFLGSDFKQKIGNAFEGLADMIGVDLEEIPSALGKELGKQAMDAFKDTDIGKKVSEKFSSVRDTASSKMRDAFNAGVDKYNKTPDYNIFKDIFSKRRSQSSAKDAATNYARQSAAQGATNMAADTAKSAASNVASNAVKGAASNVAKGAAESVAGNAAKSVATSAMASGATNALVTTGGTTAMTTAGATTAGGAAAGATAAGASGAGAAVAGLGSAAAAACPYILAAIAVIAIISIKLKQLSAAVAPLKEGFQELKEASKNAANRYMQSRKAMQENEKKRLAEDVNTIIEAPFKILESAAEKVYETWDANLRMINATQGYNKAGLQELIGNYAERLREEGLTNVISADDITSNLASVLDSGLSGKVAEEFAYIASKLNSAIPTQDFFNYASTYASIAANEIARGRSESEAIAYANAQMEIFASNVLYASRQLSGGFSTGLKDAQSLFESSVHIANAAKTGNAAQIGGVLTSVSAIVGAIAPDLASGIVEAVVNAATGGNSDQIVALRSLAGINASNTEFLKAIAKDPQSVFVAMFSKLSQMQNMSPDNYMEVADSLSDLFGLSKEAFQRVDFNYLAQAIGAMNVSADALNENIDHLASGETTTTAEQLRMQQINKYMLDEGLAYVLDNEAARAIQQHMWDEQLANALMEAQYGVELKGAALSFLEGISQTVQNIIDFLNPFSWVKKLGNLVATAVEANAQEADIKQVLELGKVGQGDIQQLYNLTTRGIDLKLTDSLVNLIGGKSAYQAAHNGTQIYGAITNPFTSIKDLNDIGGSGLSALLQYALGSGSSGNSAQSRYAWNTVGKSIAQAITVTTPSESFNTSVQQMSSYQQQALSANQKAQQETNAKIQELVGKISEYAGPEGEGYNAWTQLAATQYQIKDLDQALKNAGYTTEQVKNQFNQEAAKAASEYEHKRDVTEEQFWIDTVTELKTANEWLAGIDTRLDDIQYRIFPEQFLLIQETNAQLVTANKTLSTIKDTTLPNVRDSIVSATNTVNSNVVLIYTRLGTTNTLISDLKEIIQKNNNYLPKLYSKLSEFYKGWVAYFVDHTAYSKAYKHSDVDKIQRQSDAQKSDAVYALADALTANTVDLKDPAIQTNALLSQILLVATSIMQQNNKTAAGSSLVETLNGLALGIIK